MKMTNHKRIVNRQELAILMGLHSDSIATCVMQGMPIETFGKGIKYDAVECLDWQRQRIGKNAKDAAQTRALTASAELNELKLKLARAQARRESRRKP